ncbi:MAG: nucleotidyl transferase AbiEii/AbiGii toxin family protein [Acidobacteriota bacterium]
MNRIFEAALHFQAFAEDRLWEFCIIGGLAVQRWGEPRLTLDADLTLLTGFGNEERFIDEILAHHQGRRPDAREFALRYRVLLAEAPNGVPLDISLGALPFEERSIQRSSDWKLPANSRLRTCSAEDLIIHKCFAGRPGDWRDVQGILFRQTEGLDVDLIFSELQPLVELKETPEAIDQLKKLLNECRSQ